MAFDAHKEDFQRLGLRRVTSLDETDPFGAARSMADFGWRFEQNRDSLPQSDEDRAFRLVVRATDLLDYQLPFAADTATGAIMDDAHKLLEEAIELDADCHDARRMLAATSSSSFEDLYRLLSNGEESVRCACERSRAAVAGDLPQGSARTLAEELSMRPYERWAAALAAHALECGRYRRSIEVSLRLLKSNPSDVADVRFTLAYAYAKLEDTAGLDALMRRHPDGRRRRNPWYGLARVALAFKARDFSRAEREVDCLIANHPHAGLTLARQDWLPNGVFARIAVEPRSEDELILAVSEGTVILQEGCDSHERGALGSWLAGRPEVVQSRARDGALTTESTPNAGGPGATVPKRGGCS